MDVRPVGLLDGGDGPLGRAVAVKGNGVGDWGKNRDVRHGRRPLGAGLGDGKAGGRGDGGPGRSVNPLDEDATIGRTCDGRDGLAGDAADGLGTPGGTHVDAAGVLDSSTVTRGEDNARLELGPVGKQHDYLVAGIEVIDQLTRAVVRTVGGVVSAHAPIREGIAVTVDAVGRSAVGDLVVDAIGRVVLRNRTGASVGLVLDDVGHQAEVRRERNGMEGTVMVGDTVDDVGCDGVGARDDLVVVVVGPADDAIAVRGRGDAAYAGGNRRA